LSDSLQDRRVSKYVCNHAYAVIPAKAGNYTKELDSRFHGKPWIPHQVRNDNLKFRKHRVGLKVKTLLFYYDLL